MYVDKDHHCSLGNLTKNYTYGSHSVGSGGTFFDGLCRETEVLRNINLVFKAPGFVAVYKKHWAILPLC